jgi:hypothetical protein
MPRMKQKRNTKSHRISARITAQCHNLLAEMSSVTGQSTSAIIEQAIANCHPTVAASNQRPWLLLKKSGLINAGRADRDLSSNYKSALTESLKIKRKARS